jgi:hypothetical protein
MMGSIVMRASYFLAAAIVVGCSQVSFAEDVSIRGPGAASCGAWVQGRSGQDSESISRRFDRESWIMGYITAFNVFVERGDIVQSTDPPGIFAWIDSYCSTHPLQSVADAAFALVAELRSRK